MATGYVLVLAVLFLGGVIATLGDRIGMGVGKARLSLFNLRPRQTATLITILTGSVISASTLLVLFGVSRQLRTGVFQLEQIQADLNQAQTGLDTAKQEKELIETELATARQRQGDAQDRLREINRFLQTAIQQRQDIQDELGQTQGQLQQRQQALEQTQGQLQQTRGQLSSVSNQINTLETDISRLESDLDLQIAQRDREIAQRQQRLSQLQAQQALLQEDVTRLEQQYQDIFLGNVALSRFEPLWLGIIRANTPEEARQAIDRLLREANRTALQRIAPEPGAPRNRQVLLLSPDAVERLITRISDQQEYVVRVLSAANYLIGEPCVVSGEVPCVQVVFDASLNRLLYESGAILATTAVDTSNLTNQGLVEEYNLLISALLFRARQNGLVGDTVQIADGDTETILSFLSEVQAAQQPLEIQAIASNDISTIGPLRVDLIAIGSGQIVAGTNFTPPERAPRLER
ncbi:MAG: DUF3084 domain-containing protein [Cyanobacteria bacterium]|nr:DUF3084 domain-containing protein [Cyanobacteriota bacterium]